MFYDQRDLYLNIHPVAKDFQNETHFTLYLSIKAFCDEPL